MMVFLLGISRVLRLRTSTQHERWFSKGRSNTIVEKPDGRHAEYILWGNCSHAEFGHLKKKRQSTPLGNFQHKVGGSNPIHGNFKGAKGLYIIPGRWTTTPKHRTSRHGAPWWVLWVQGWVKERRELTHPRGSTLPWGIMQSNWCESHEPRISWHRVFPLIL